MTQIITQVSVKENPQNAGVTTKCELFSPSLCEALFVWLKTRARRPRSNGRGDEKSRSPRADRERKDAQIRGEAQMKTNLL